MVLVSACLVIPNSATGQREALNLSALVNIQAFLQWTLERPEVAERLRVSAERQSLSSLDFSFRRFGIQSNGRLMFIKCSFVTFASWSDPGYPHPNNLLWICSPQQLEALVQTLVISSRLQMFNWFSTQPFALATRGCWSHIQDTGTRLASNSVNGQGPFYISDMVESSLTTRFHSLIMVDYKLDVCYCAVETQDSTCSSVAPSHRNSHTIWDLYMI